MAFRFAGGLGFIPELEFDAYLQLPRRALLGLDGGVGAGVLAPCFVSTSPMPYAELGFVRSRGGPYVVAGYVHEPLHMLEAEGRQVLHADGVEATLAYEIVADRGVLRPFVTTVLGHRYAMHCAGVGSDCSN